MFYSPKTTFLAIIANFGHLWMVVYTAITKILKFAWSILLIFIVIFNLYVKSLKPKNYILLVKCNTRYNPWLRTNLYTSFIAKAIKYLFCTVAPLSLPLYQSNPLPFTSIKVLTISFGLT